MFGNIVATKIDLLAAQWSKIPTEQGDLYNNNQLKPNGI